MHILISKRVLLLLWCLGAVLHADLPAAASPTGWNCGHKREIENTAPHIYLYGGGGGREIENQTRLTSGEIPIQRESEILLRLRLIIAAEKKPIFDPIWEGCRRIMMYCVSPVFILIDQKQFPEPSKHDLQLFRVQLQGIVS